MRPQEGDLKSCPSSIGCPRQQNSPTRPVSLMQNSFQRCVALFIVALPGQTHWTLSGVSPQPSAAPPRRPVTVTQARAHVTCVRHRRQISADPPPPAENKASRSRSFVRCVATRRDKVPPPERTPFRKHQSPFETVRSPHAVRLSFAPFSRSWLVLGSRAESARKDRRTQKPSPISRHVLTSR